MVVFIKRQGDYLFARESSSKKLQIKNHVFHMEHGFGSDTFLYLLASYVSPCSTEKLKI